MLDSEINLCWKSSRQKTLAGGLLGRVTHFRGPSVLGWAAAESHSPVEAMGRNCSRWISARMNQFRRPDGVPVSYEGRRNQAELKPLRQQRVPCLFNPWHVRVRWHHNATCPLSGVQLRELHSFLSPVCCVSSQVCFSLCDCNTLPAHVAPFFFDEFVESRSSCFEE